MKVLSLFAGAGGLDLGFIKAGHEIILANDFNKSACETYKANIGDHILCCDVNELNEKNLPYFDMLTGGFPCQGFSTMGKNEVNDKRNFLYLEILRILKEKQPNYFLLENVKNILFQDNGRTMQRIMRDISEANYFCYPVLVNSKNYSVAQNRERVFFVGIKKEMGKNYAWDCFSLFPPKKHDKIITAGEVIGVIEDYEAEFGIIDSSALETKYIHRNVIIERNNIVPCICKEPQKHYNNKRRLSVRECKLLQGFPDWFEFKGSKTSQYRQIGNAISPPVAYEFGKIFKNIELNLLNLQ